MKSINFGLFSSLFLPFFFPFPRTGDDFYGVANYHYTASTVCEPLWPIEEVTQNDEFYTQNDGFSTKTR